MFMSVGQGSWISGSGFLNIGGWTYGIPLLTSVPLQHQYGTNKLGGPLYCIGQNDFVFTDPAGERHALTSLTYFASTAACASTTSFSDDRYMSRIASDTGGVIEVANHDGTVFTFGLPNEEAKGGTVASETALPISIEDRNGNKATVTDSGGGAFTITDSNGRPAVSSTGFGTAGSTYDLTVDGLSSYQVTWGSASANYTVGYTQVTGNDCRGINSVTASQPVITSITLPNGQQYQFQYDAVYGLLSKVIYPNGAYSRYVWGLNPRSDQAYFLENTSNGPLTCTYEYDTPAVLSRYVSFDGSTGHEVLEEDYSYGTTWTGSSATGWSNKNTTVTTTVRVVSNAALQPLGSFTTSYAYTPYGVNQNPYDITQSSGAVALQVPLEQSVAYGDFTGSAPLKTVTKTWQDQFLMASQNRGAE
jgi:hypothetical protein